ncbi:hypothetical protein ACFLRM_05070 [Acidobacteriota bacterium]
MKMVSYVCLTLAAFFLVVSVFARYVLGGKIIFNFFYYVNGAELMLLAAIVFALYHLIELQSK